jgi:E3 ubiquitin-protein ligase MGRN1
MGAAPSSPSAPGASPPAQQQQQHQPLHTRTLGARPVHGGAPAPSGDLPAAAARALTGAGPVLRHSSAIGTRAHPHDKRPAPVAFPAPVQRQAIVGNVVNLHKQTLRVVPAPSTPHVYLVEFDFDATVDGFITVYYAAEQHVQLRPATPDATSAASSSAGAGARRVERVLYTGAVDARPAKTPFPPGSRQAYRQKLSKGMHTSAYTASDFFYVDGSTRFPLVIRLEAIYPSDSPVPLDERVQTQTTLATFKPPLRVGDPHTCSVIRQEVLVGGSVYIIQELYGIAGEVTTSMLPPETGQPMLPRVSSDSSTPEIGNECVICLTEPCSTAVLPCNHLCMCSDCSERLCSDANWERRRCPVCRTPFGSLLRIIAKPPPVTSTEADAADVAAASHRPQRPCQEDTGGSLLLSTLSIGASTSSGTTGARMT